MSVIRWFCEIDGKSHGPVTSLELRRLAVAGRLRPSSPVWKEGRPQRVQAITVKGLFDGLPEADRSTSPHEDFEVVEEVEEVVEAVEESEVLAEAPVIYREGHPELKGPVSGMLIVETTGIRFAFVHADQEEDSFRVAFARIDEIREPSKGDFPDTMKRAALGAKVGGAAGKLAAGFMGDLVGGYAGDAIAGVGHQAGKMAERGGELGQMPRNRISVLARLRKMRCKLVFDADGSDREAMNQEAKSLYKHLDKAFRKAVPDEPEEEPAPVALVGSLPSERQSASKDSAPVVPVSVPGKPFRVMSAGQVRGPYSLEDLRAQLADGSVSAADLIGFETWVPAATLAGLSPTTATKPTSGAAVPKKEEDGLIAADDEFKL